jgi:hypothetical protein
MARHAAEDQQAEARDSAEEVVPTFSEQLADQLGGARGVLESSIPVVVFILVNTVWAKHLNVALAIAGGSALAIAVIRLARRQTVRHAVNGLVGVAIGGFLAYRTGSARDFYLPGIILSCLYGVALLISVLIRRPAVGWVWSLLAARGSTEWRAHPAMVRLFSRLTVLWALVYIAKTVIQAWLFQSTAADDPATGLGIAALLLRWPPYALLIALTVWAVRRHTAAQQQAEI